MKGLPAMVDALHHPSKRAFAQSANNFIWEGDRDGGKEEREKKEDKKKSKETNNINKKENRQENQKGRR